MMKIFLTGASGYLGGVLTEHFVGAGHQVDALARSAPLDPSRAEKVLGWEPVERSLVDDLRTGSYAHAAAAS